MRVKSFVIWVPLETNTFKWSDSIFSVAGKKIRFVIGSTEFANFYSLILNLNVCIFALCICDSLIFDSKSASGNLCSLHLENYTGIFALCIAESLFSASRKLYGNLCSLYWWVFVLCIYVPLFSVSGTFSGNLCSLTLYHDLWLISLCICIISWESLSFDSKSASVNLCSLNPHHYMRIYVLSIWICICESLFYLSVELSENLFLCVIVYVSMHQLFYWYILY